MSDYGSLEAILSYADVTDYATRDDMREAQKVPLMSATGEDARKEPVGGGRRIAPTWRHAKMLISSAAIFLFVCAVTTVRRPGAAVRRAEPSLRATTSMRLDAQAQADDHPLVRASNSDYGEVKWPTVRVYGLALVMEPYRDTTLEVLGGAAGLKVQWYVHLLDRASGQPSGESLYDGVSDSDDGTISVMCTSPGDFYRVTVTAVDDTGAVVRSYSTDKATCRYVRREIRSLTDNDREAYLSALEVMYRTPLDDGVAAYGERFANYELFTTMHNSMSYCYHGGDQFITSHAAFTQLLDESLQLMAPHLTQPYWDFMVDSAQLGTEWFRSVLYSDSWFGSVDNAEKEGYVISRGRFAYLPVASDHTRRFSAFGSDYNSLGYSTSKRNLNPSPYVQRSRHMCGLAENQRLATCDAFTSCFDTTTSLAEWTLCMEVDVHANMHEWHGGAFNCAENLGELARQYPQYGTDLLMFLGTVAHDVWYIYTKETVSQFTECADVACAGDEEGRSASGGESLGGECGCRCSLDFEAMGEEELIETMAGTLFTLQFIFVNGASFVLKEEEGGSWRFSNGGVEKILPYDDHVKLLRVVARLFCEGGLSGPLGTGAASNDPIFWPLHPIFDRAWHLLLLSDKYSASYDMTWTNGSCHGAAWGDQQVFTNLLGDGTGVAYTNAELWTLLGPSNANLPYMYDDLSLWGTCSDWAPCASC